jgi:hypothetical protein
MPPEVSETATWTAPDKAERLWFLGTLATIKVPGEASHGRFALIEFLFPRYASPPLHTHPQERAPTRPLGAHARRSSLVTTQEGVGVRRIARTVRG